MLIRSILRLPSVVLGQLIIAFVINQLLIINDPSIPFEFTADSALWFRPTTATSSMASVAAFKINTKDVKCEEELGCFAITPDFKNKKIRPLQRLPYSRAKVNTRFMLYTRLQAKYDAEGHMLQAWNDVTLLTSPFNRKLPTKFLIPGFMDAESRSIWMVKVREALLAHGDYNVIVVSWKNLTPVLALVANTRMVGAEVANLIYYLMVKTGIDPESIHLIGHSMGCHIAGYAGERINKIGRITALDPARVMFQGMPISVRLDPSDAIFVDVIHSDFSQDKKAYFFPMGFQEPLGHIDFYPNGRYPQPGCYRDIKLSGLSGLIVGKVYGKQYALVQAIRYATACSHQRAHEWFLESLINDQCEFVGVKCANYEQFRAGLCTCDDGPSACSTMGMNADNLFYANLHRLHTKPPESHRWFLKTRDRPFYCLHQLQLSLQLGSPLLLNYPFLLTIDGAIHYTIVSSTGHILNVQLPTKANSLAAGVRYPYLITSETPLGSIKSISVSWQPFEKAHIPTALLQLNVIHVKVSPIKATYGTNVLPLTRYFCPLSLDQRRRRRRKRRRGGKRRNSGHLTDATRRSLGIDPQIQPSGFVPGISYKMLPSLDCYNDDDD